MGYCGYCRFYEPTINCEMNCRRTFKAVGFLQERECFTAKDAPIPEPAPKAADPVPAEEKTQGRNRSWSDEDVEYLKEAYKTKTARYIAEKLGRTHAAVTRKINILGIKPETHRGGRRRKE